MSGAVVKTSPYNAGVAHLVPGDPGPVGLVVVSVTWAFLSPMPSAPFFALSGPHTAVNQSKSRLYPITELF